MKPVGHTDVHLICDGCGEVLSAEGRTFEEANEKLLAQVTAKRWRLRAGEIPADGTTRAAGRDLCSECE